MITFCLAAALASLFAVYGMTFPGNKKERNTVAALMGVGGASLGALLGLVHM